jgi:hypothetical protein
VLRRHRFGIPALLVTGLYAGTLGVATVIALSTGDLGALWRLTLFTEVAEDVAVTWVNTIVLIAAGLPCAWALWQSLRGPLAGPPPELDRDARRLRAGLYVAAASWAFYVVAPSWPWWAAALDAVVMWVVVLLFQSVLGGSLEQAHHARTAGVVAYGGLAAIAVLDALGWPQANWLLLICGIGALLWTVLVLRAQRRDSRWRRATVRYGIAGLVVPIILSLTATLLDRDTSMYHDVALTAEFLTVIWLARSAHDLADPRDEPAPPVASPLAAEPPATS